MEHPVTFPSDGLTLTGKLSVPSGGAARKAAIIVMHGFGGHHDRPQQA